MWETSDGSTFFVHFYIQEYSDYLKDNMNYFIYILHSTKFLFCKIHYVNFFYFFVKEKEAPLLSFPNLFCISLITAPAYRHAGVLLTHGRNRFQIPYPLLFCILPQSCFPQKSEWFLRNRLRVHGTHHDFLKYFH